MTASGITNPSLSAESGTADEEVKILSGRANSGSTLEQALALAKQKIPVVPCDPTSTRPLPKMGVAAASTIAPEIKLWWKAWPRALIGVPRDKASGLFAVNPNVPKESGDA